MFYICNFLKILLLDNRCKNYSFTLVYGRPTAEMQERAERGEIILGGCIPKEYNYQCRDCESFYFEDDEDEE